MKASELRIGNFISTSYMTSKVFEVTELHENDISFKSNEQNFKSHTIYSYVDPIELTEEWLIKFGFEKNSSNKYWFRKKQLCISVIGMVELMSWDMQIFKIDTQIKYVHQLQNLYFALTGQELEIIQK